MYLKSTKLCDNHDYCHVEIPNNDNNTSKYNHGEKSLKTPWVIYADFECLPIKNNHLKIISMILIPKKKAVHEACGYSLDLVSSFDLEQNKHSFYRRRDCTKKICKDLKELTTKVINYEEKDMIPLTDSKNKFYEEQEVCHICKKEFCYDKNEKNKFKLYQKVRNHCHYTGKFRVPAHSICYLRYKVQREISVINHNGSNYDYDFIIKELAEDFKSQFECLGENTEKNITFSVPIKKENDEDGKIITCKIKFFDSCRFMQSKLSDLTDNLSEINNKDLKKSMERKKN